MCVLKVTCVLPVQTAVGVPECGGHLQQSCGDSPAGAGPELRHHHGSDAQHHPADVHGALRPALSAERPQDGGQLWDQPGRSWSVRGIFGSNLFLLQSETE